MDTQLGVFTSDQVLRLTGVTKRRLDYWIQRGLVVPEISRARGRGSVRLFSFENLLEVKVAVWLRSKDVSLQLIRKIVGKLKKRGLSHP
ncbi:MAG: MerR family transcriptional regulator, partial [Actinomycetota bacterium]